MITRCWKCRYDVEDMLTQETPVCPECGSPIDKLDDRTRVHRRREYLVRAKYSSAFGLFMLLVAQFSTGDYEIPDGVTAMLAVPLAVVAFGLAMNFLDRMSWPLECKSRLQLGLLVLRAAIALGLSAFFTLNLLGVIAFIRIMIVATFGGPP